MEIKREIPFFPFGFARVSEVRHIEFEFKTHLYFFAVFRSSIGHSRIFNKEDFREMKLTSSVL